MEIPQTPAGEQLRWYLSVMASDMVGLTVLEASQHLKIPVTRTDDELRDDWIGWSRRVGHCTLTAVDRSEPFEIIVELETDKDTRYRLNIAVDADSPHKIKTFEWTRLYDFEVVVREATPADGPVLAEIERRAPIVMGDSLVTFDRSADYLAAARLMEDATVVMAEVDGDPAAVEWAACHRAQIGGAVYRMVNYIHLRVADKHQRKGLWGALVSKLNEKYPQDVKIDHGYQCAARLNAAIQQAFAGQSSWSIGPIRALISAAGQAEVSHEVRTASSGDAEFVVDLLNKTHGREEMYFPYTVESFRARVERAPELYSWDQIWRTDNAVLGVWPSGEQITVIRESQGSTHEAKHGLVLDYGFRSGAEAEFQELLRAWCGWLATHDHTHLSIFTSEASAGFDVIKGMTEQLELFDIWTPPIAEPEEAALYGVYMDQVYF